VKLSKLFSSLKSPADLQKECSISKSPVSSEALRKGAERQWKRLNDPVFQTQEMLRAIDRAVPRKGK
jgi:hypothetical protein